MESVLAVRDEYRMQNWAKIISERQESGQTVKDYCAQHAIAENAYGSGGSDGTAAGAAGRKQFSSLTDDPYPLWYGGAEASGGC